MGAMAPPVPDKDCLLCTSWHFLVKNNEFYGPYFLFFQKISSLTLLGMNIIIFFSQSPSLTHCYILHAYFYIILTEVITFLILKD